jgi:hypothetical protein
VTTERKTPDPHVEPGHEAEAVLARGDTSALGRDARKKRPLVALVAAAAAVGAIAVIALTQVNSGIGTDRLTTTAATMPITADGQSLGMSAE